MADVAIKVYDLLMQLASIGSPVLRQMDHGGWYANVEFPAPEGVTAKASSDFEHKTPLEALQCVHDRLGGLRSMLSVPSPVAGIYHQSIGEG